MGIEAKIVDKTGAWLSYGDLRIGQGRENAKQFLKENPQLADEIEAKLRKHLNLAPMQTPAEKPASAETPAAKPVSAPVESSREKEKARR
jgi:hypothetical protein